MTSASGESVDREWLIERWYRAVVDVLDGSPIGEVAVRYWVSSQTVHAWKDKYLPGGIETPCEPLRLPRPSLTRMELWCEIRRPIDAGSSADHLQTRPVGRGIVTITGNGARDPGS